MTHRIVRKCDGCSLGEADTVLEFPPAPHVDYCPACMPRAREWHRRSQEIQQQHVAALLEELNKLRQEYADLNELVFVPTQFQVGDGSSR